MYLQLIYITTTLANQKGFISQGGVNDSVFTAVYVVLLSFSLVELEKGENEILEYIRKGSTIESHE